MLERDPLPVARVGRRLPAAERARDGLPRATSRSPSSTPTRTRSTRGCGASARSGYVPAVDTWFVTRYADVQPVAEKPDLFTADARRLTGRADLRQPDDHHRGRRRCTTSCAQLRRQVPAPRRRGLHRGPGPPDRRAARPDAAAGGVEADLMAAYFEPVSVRSLAAVLGLADVGSDELRRWFKGMNLGATNYERDRASRPSPMRSAPTSTRWSCRGCARCSTTRTTPPWPSCCTPAGSTAARGRSSSSCRR